jgi:branched-chain amino acid transport system permease protein
VSSVVEHQTAAPEAGGRQAQPARGRRARLPLYAIGVVVVVALAVAPQTLSPYLTNLIILTAITSIPVASLMMLFGYAGQVSLGQAAFYGVGAYVYAILSAKHGVNPWLAMVVAVVLTACFAYLIGRGLLRLKGYYLAMVTAALGVIAETCFSNLTGLTGGYSGVTGIPFIQVPGLDVTSTKNFYYVLIAFCALTLLVVRLLATGEYGRVLRAMRESETVSAAYGVPIAHARAQIFAVSAGLAAMGGCLYAQYVQFISPDNFTSGLSISLFLGAVIGGLSSIGGAVLGAAYVVVLPELASSYSDWEVAITGLLTLLILLFAPRGVAGLLGRGWAALVQLVRGRRAGARAEGAGT